MTATIITGSSPALLKWEFPPFSRKKTDCEWLSELPKILPPKTGRKQKTQS
jgi:hypothetical protein